MVSTHQLQCSYWQSSNSINRLIGEIASSTFDMMMLKRCCAASSTTLSKTKGLNGDMPSRHKFDCEWLLSIVYGQSDDFINLDHSRLDKEVQNARTY